MKSAPFIFCLIVGLKELVNMKNENTKRIRVVDAMVIALILMLSGVCNVCSGQEFVNSHEYFILSDIDPEMFDLVQIKVDDKLKKIKKNQSEYKILRNPKSLFTFRGTCIDKNDIDYFIFSNGNTKYYFPHNDKKGVQFDFRKYADDFSVYKQNVESQIDGSSYIDTEKASASLGINFSNTDLLYSRFLILTLKTIELSEEQTVICSFVAGNNEFSVSYRQFKDVCNKILVSNSKKREFDDLRERTNKYKSWYKYIDIQHATSVSIKDSANLVCGRFYPIDIKDVISSEDWEPLIVFSIDGKEHTVSEERILREAAAYDVVTQCKDFYNFIESAKQQFKYISVFSRRVVFVSLSDTSLLYGKFSPIIDLKGLITPSYSKFVEVKCESKNDDMLLPLNSFQEYAYTSDMLQSEKDKYDKVMEEFETIKRDYVYYWLDDEQIVPMEVLDAKINENYEIVKYDISYNSSKHYVFSDEFNQSAMTKDEYAEEQKRIKQAQEEERRRIAQAQEEERKNNVFFVKNLKGYAFYRQVDLTTYCSSKEKDAEGSFIVGMIMTGLGSDAISMVELFKFDDNKNGAFGIKANADRSKVNMYDSDALSRFLRSVSIASEYEEVTKFTYSVSGNKLVMTGETTNVSTGKKSTYSKTLVFNEKDHTLRDGNIIYKRERIE